GGELWVAHSDGRTLTAGGIHDGLLALGFDPWFTMGAGLLGFAAPSGDSLNVSEDERTPWVDLFAHEFAVALGHVGVDLRPRSLWPGNAPFAVCLTHDVDRSRKTFQYVTHLGRTKGLHGAVRHRRPFVRPRWVDRKSTRLNSSHVSISYAVFCLKKKKINKRTATCI